MVVIQNDVIRIPHKFDPQLIERIDELTSYRIAGAQFTPQFKAKVWDGRQRFLRRTMSGYMLPTGLLTEVWPVIQHANIEDARRMPREPFPTAWDGLELRDYQLESVAAATLDRGLGTGKGMLNLPIRSGKTIIASALIAHLGVPTLFVVESTLLLHQTAKEFGKRLKTKIGILGDGIHDVQQITVATVQTLLARKRLGANLLRNVDLLIVDECHHLKAPEWGRMLIRADSFYKFGLSATIFMDPKRPNERDAIWFRACTGPILHKVSVSRLIKDGYLFAPHIIIHPITQPKLVGKMKFHEVYKQGIEQNEHRNGKIVELALEYINKGMRVLIDTGRLRQVATLFSKIRNAGVAVEKMTGSTKSDVRQHILKRFKTNEVNCIVGTVLGEGVDIPELEVVINAEGQKARTATVQRMRNLTACSEKQSVIFIDFMDNTSAKLRQHSRERLKTYQSYRGFKVEVIDG